MISVHRNLLWAGMFFVVASMVAGASLFGDKFRSPPSEMLFIQDETIRVGIDRSKGASITWLSWNENPQNIVNSYDPGRLIQQSYYAGKRLDRISDGQSENWSPWAWNPIQGGGVSSWARVTSFEKIDDRTLYGVTIPKLWDMHDEEAAAVMKQWTSFEPGMTGTVVVRNRIECDRDEDDPWGDAAIRPQEVPACYFTRNFDRFESYLGHGQWRNEKHQIGPPWRKTTPPLGAMACFNSDGQGVAIYSPTANADWNYGPHVNRPSDDPSGGPCVHIAPITKILFGPKSVYEYRYWLTVGTASEIAETLDLLIAKHKSETARLETPIKAK